MSPNLLKKNKENVSHSREISPSTSSINLNVSPTKPSESSPNIFTELLALAGISDGENADYESNEQCATGQFITDTSDAKDLACRINNTNLSRAFSPKRSHSSSDSSCSSSKVQAPKKLQQKKVKSSPPTSIKEYNITLDKDYRTTTIGDLTLTWPSYGIKKAIYAGECFSIFNTCPIDTGLFVLYHAYKSGTDQFRNLLEDDTLEAYTLLRRTFQLVESDGWTVARLYWLTEKNLLREKNRNGQYDLENTMDEIVFKFTKPMQTFPLKSKCTCSACPKPIRNHMSVELSLTYSKTEKKFLNFIPEFATIIESRCGADLGTIEPLDYPADYMIDERQLPIVTLETNMSHSEIYYVCQALRRREVAHFIYSAPFVVLSVENNESSIRNLPDPLYIGAYEYRLSAGIRNTGAHFIAIIKSNNGDYYCFDDLDSRGCFLNNALPRIQFAIYVLKI